MNRAIEQARRSFSESENDILRRLLLRHRGVGQQQGAGSSTGAAPSPSRTRGLWTVEMLGRRESAANLKDAYRVTLERLAERFPNFLREFSQEKARSRRFVAREPRALYGKAPHLADKYAKPLVDGWFFDTNLSTVQVSQRVKVAARLCGLLYGKDLRILDNMREI